MDASKLAAKSSVQALVSTKKPEPVQPKPETQAKPQPAPKPPQQEAKPRPTTNSQGQRIGTRLNVTA